MSNGLVRVTVKRVAATGGKPGLPGAGRAGRGGGPLRLRASNRTRRIKQLHRS